MASKVCKLECGGGCYTINGAQVYFGSCPIHGESKENPWPPIGKSIEVIR